MIWHYQTLGLLRRDRATEIMSDSRAGVKRKADDNNQRGGKRAKVFFLRPNPSVFIIDHFNYRGETNGLPRRKILVEHQMFHVRLRQETLVYG